MRAFVSSCAERLPLLINSSSWPRSSAVNRTTYFLTAISFPATNHLYRWLAATEIQKLPSFSMTEAIAFVIGFVGVISAANKSVLDPPEADSHLALLDVQATDADAMWQRGGPITVLTRTDHSGLQRRRRLTMAGKSGMSTHMRPHPTKRP